MVTAQRLTDWSCPHISFMYAYEMHMHADDDGQRTASRNPPSIRQRRWGTVSSGEVAQ